jgi:hypothetical protein
MELTGHRKRRMSFHNRSQFRSEMIRALYRAQLRKDLKAASAAAVGSCGSASLSECLLGDGLSDRVHEGCK